MTCVLYTCGHPQPNPTQWFRQREELHRTHKRLVSLSRMGPNDTGPFLFRSALVDHGPKDIVGEGLVRPQWSKIAVTTQQAKRGGQLTRVCEQRHTRKAQQEGTRDVPDSGQTGLRRPSLHVWVPGTSNSWKSWAHRTPGRACYTSKTCCKATISR